MNAIASEVADGNILKLIEKFLRSGVIENGIFKPTTIGTPQGGVISPLLANAVLDHLDWTLHEHWYLFSRYADDFVIVCKSKKDIFHETPFQGLKLFLPGACQSTRNTKKQSWTIIYSSFWKCLKVKKTKSDYNIL